MYRIASMHVYDALGAVVISLKVREYPDYDGEPSFLALERAIAFPGVGEHDVSHWLLSAIDELQQSL